MDKKHGVAATTLAALGIVYGDIGTSPLYALKESFAASHIEPNQMNIFGFVSLIFWSLLLIVTLKYVVFILRADNKGEGGVIILMQQALRYLHGKPAWLVMMMGLIGTALFYGDAMITPAISVLSAAEGLTVIHAGFRDWVMPIALVILVGLFVIQKHGTQKIGTFFGPVMLIWFASIALIGLYQIAQHPRILLAINPLYGLTFAWHHGWGGFIGLGCVVLAVTGAEALYADMGHFGRRPIQLAWVSLVLPSLALNYMGQGALLMHSPSALSNPFFLSVPHWGLLPLIALATLATVIASQAVISGAFSLTRQAIQLGFSPRMSIVHTSAEEMGQIYMPTVNWMLLGAVTLVVITFHDSAHLASAYGIAVTGTMVMTTIMFALVMRNSWRWPIPVVLGLTGLFLSFDLVFFGANLLKLVHGGWFPMLVALVVVFVFSTWRRGRLLIQDAQRDNSGSLADFLQNLQDYPPQIVDGNAVFMVSDPFSIPRALLHNLKHNRVLHEYNVLLTIQTKDVPHVANIDRVAIKQLSPRFTRIIANYGFQETPNITQILALVAEQGIELSTMETSFFLSRDSITVAEKTAPGHMARLRTGFFKWLYKNSTAPTDYYRIPGNRVVELGAQVSL
ncbi:potassium transporter Kup [Snodgrassella sp. CFCC 13594]|uniref:potassium transporter Kup n=1 Tax=Snodgrassella sp. CFCC 13594 TaxID=1775559 RepID=UPI000834ACBB|nr:potassium transporter Kup [Snodgrassella sp. CFCC 13594]